MAGTDSVARRREAVIREHQARPHATNQNARIRPSNGAVTAFALRSDFRSNDTLIGQNS